MDKDLTKIFIRYSRHAEFIGDHLNDVSQVGAFGSQVLHLAAFAGNCDDVMQMLEAGADPNAAGDLGMSPIHYGVLGNSADIIEILVAAGAMLEAPNEFGETPVQMARLMGRKDIEQLLCKLGAAPSLGTDGGSKAAERWAEFESMQHENFWKD